MHIGLRRHKKDFGWLFSKVPASAAGTYTTNQFQAAPTKLTKQMIDQGHQLQGLLLNSAIANSCTGEQGWQNALQEQAWLANKLNVAPNLIGVASTGLIGAQLPMDKIKNGLPQLTPTKSDAVTYAVLTTDQHPKTVCVQCELSGQLVTLTGFAKGSGMIHPKMATMLGFVTTDAQIDEQLQQWWSAISAIEFTTTLIPATRGIMTTIYAKAKSALTTTQVCAAFTATYHEQPFVQVLPTGMPTLKDVVGSNNCALGVDYNPVTNTIVVVSVIDNLMKGAAGQAVQNFNRYFDFAVTAGLPTLPVFP
ncbi:hypothetical protein WP50_04080 [Lactiplantibacillus plantarum]|nr:hypothetical protein WP50_04080 [Lactiplantibacillus plantarum]